ncbi:FAD-dependent monooxygenase [Vogesella fluminis]|uniref:FAD-dependent monooxygenase n=1 Tax=Vogesella fluminis TaxID=1069161 RepID=UPI003645DFA1
MSAISPASRQLLAAIGAWPHIEAMRSTPYRRMLVWENDEQEGTLFDAAGLGEAELGHIIENRIVQLACQQALSQHGNIELICPDRLQSLSEQADHCLVTLGSGRRIAARLVVAADGAQSAARRLTGIGINSHDYPMHAFVATFAIEGGERDITWQRFTANGLQSLLPLPGDYASLVWYHQPARVRELETLSEAALIAAFQREFPARLPVLRQLVSRGSFALTRRHAQQYHRGRVVLAGDAVHTIHPLAGQGVNLGFQDVQALSALLHEAFRQGQDPAAPALLQRYQRQRMLPNHAMQRLMDAFCYGFGNSAPPLRLLRNLALKLANRPGRLKQEVVRYALGLSPLARGLRIDLPGK